MGFSLFFYPIKFLLISFLVCLKYGGLKIKGLTWRTCDLAILYFFFKFGFGLEQNLRSPGYQLNSHSCNLLALLCFGCKLAKSFFEIKSLAHTFLSMLFPLHSVTTYSYNSYYVILIINAYTLNLFNYSNLAFVLYLVWCCWVLLSCSSYVCYK